MSGKVLIFPSTIEASLAFVTEAKRWGSQVVGASSMQNDLYAKHYDAWEHLPYIHEGNFLNQLNRVVTRHNITTIYTPHAPSFLHLSQIMDQIPGVRLMGEAPYTLQTQRVKSALENVDTAFISAITPHYHRLGKGFLAALFAQAATLYGECRQEKIAAMCAIFCDAPQGDVVEIGSFFGKSAYALNRLAAHFNIGTTLAIDPWNMSVSIQTESPETIQDLSTKWDWEVVFNGFLLTMQALNAKPFNYIRNTSTRAHATYVASNYIVTEHFGETPISHKISVLHIDANHDETAVAEDLAHWGQHIIPGGWIIFDDYEWSNGDGPRKVADKMARERASDIDHHFVAGGAAFFKLKA